MLRVLSALYPTEFPFHLNWKTSVTHPAYWTISASIEHVVAGTSGGDWLDESNLVTACWPLKPSDLPPKVNRRAI